MQNRTHTHRGTCQACGAVQAVMVKGLLAKHGYTVEWGFFNGVCAGADRLPLEVNKDLAMATISHLRDEFIPAQKARIAGLENGTVFPKWTKREKVAAFRWNDVECNRDEISDDQAATQVQTAMRKAAGRISSAKAHMSMLKNLIETRHGQPLYPVNREVRKELKAGSKVRIGGKSGWIGEVIEVKYAVARGCGPYMNGHTMMHAFIRAPKGGIAQIPTRTIRQDAILDDPADEK
jgi:hypothetical protein